MEIVIGLLFDHPCEYARSGGGMTALSPTLPEDKVEEVLAHESVHLVLERLFDLPLEEMIRLQALWDFADLGVSYNVLEKKMEAKCNATQRCLL